MDITDNRFNNQEKYHASSIATRHDTAKRPGEKKVIDKKGRQASYHRIISIMIMILSAALLTLSINNFSKEFFLAASAAKAARSTIVLSRSQPSKAKASASPHVIVTSGINRATPITTADAMSRNPTIDSSSVSSKNTEKKAGSPSVNGIHHKYITRTEGNLNGDIHSFNSTTVIGTGYTFCKMCDTDAECTGPKKCIKRRCVENEDELAVRIRNTRQQCGDCISDGDCRDGFCRSHVCAENVHELHTCKLLLASYLSSNTDRNDVQSKKVHKEVGPVDGMDKCSTDDDGDDLSKNEQTKTKDSVNINTKTTINKQNRQNIDDVNIECQDGKCHGRNRRALPSTGSDGRRQKLIDDAKNEADFKVNGMAISIEEEEALRIHEQCMISCNEKCRSRKSGHGEVKTEEENHLRNSPKPTKSEAAMGNPTAATTKPSEEDAIVTYSSPEPVQCKTIMSCHATLRAEDIEKVAIKEVEHQDEGDSGIDDVNRFQRHNGDDNFDEYDDEPGEGYEGEYKRRYGEEYAEDEDDEGYFYDPTDDDDDDLIDDDSDLYDDDDYLAGDGYYEGVDGKFYADHSADKPENVLSQEALEIMKMYGIPPHHMEPLLQGRNPKPAGKRKVNRAKSDEY